MRIQDVQNVYRSPIQHSGATMLGPKSTTDSQENPSSLAGGHTISYCLSNEMIWKCIRTILTLESMPGDAGLPKSQLRANRRTMTATTSTTLNAMKILDVAFPPLHSRHLPANSNQPSWQTPHSGPRCPSAQAVSPAPSPGRQISGCKH